jgi:hypothetical protein
MGKILIVDDQVPWIDEMKEKVEVVFADPSEVVPINRVSEAMELFKIPGYFDQYDLAVVDLELGAADTSKLADLHGRDKILPEIRRRACWLPVILMSRHITGDPNILAQLTPHDFDAVVPKGLVNDKTASGQMWSSLRTMSALSRIAHLTGRSTSVLQGLLDGKLDLVYGEGVRNQLLSVFPSEEEVETTLKDLLKLMEFSSDKIVLDDLIQGFSGLVVVRALCQRGAKETQWILKIGRSKSKLDRELMAHRKMFMDGFTRRMSVPVIWWRPVVWRGVGIIAYEFERDTQTLFASIDPSQPQKAFKDLCPALKDLYALSESRTMIPRKIVEETLIAKKDSGLDRFPKILKLLAKESDRILDEPIKVKCGAEHGDFHARNVLIGPHGPTLIDFSHYDGMHGVPLRDLAKVLVDLCFFRKLKIPMIDLITETALSREDTADLVNEYILDPNNGPSLDEKRLFSWLIRCQLCNYLGYGDVPPESKKEAEQLLASEGGKGD